MNHHNFDYSGTTPLALNDRYYGQDLARDFQFHREDAGRLVELMSEGLPKAYFSGGVVTKGAGDTLNITPAFGFPKFSVEIPLDISSRPGTKQTKDLDRVYVESTQQTNLAIPSADLGGVVTNYVKLAYSETNGTSRSREFATGSYAYERVPGFTITVDTSGATASEILLATFIGTGGGAFTITNFNPKFSMPEADFGWGRVPTVAFDMYRAGESIVLLVETDLVNGASIAILRNDVQDWRIGTWTNDTFRIHDGTSSFVPFIIEPATPTNALYMKANGDVGFGRVPTAPYDFYRASVDISLLIGTDKVNGFASLQLKNDVQEWMIRTGTDDNFNIRDVTNGISPVVIESAVPSATLYLHADGGVLIHTSTSLHPTLDTIESVSPFAIIGRSVDTNATLKTTRFALSHYTNTEEPFGIFYALADTAVNDLRIGGGTSNINAATVISFYTATNNTTVTGTEQARFENTLGALLINRTSVITGVGAGSLLQIDGDLSLRGASDADKLIAFASDASILWDESINVFVFDKGVGPNGKVLHDTTSTQDVIFDALDSYIPTVGDTISVNGGMYVATPITLALSYAKRISSTRITFYGTNASNGNAAQISANNGTAAAVSVSMVW